MPSALECRLFTGSINRDGYGWQWSKHEKVYRSAHIIAWMEKCGPVPAGMHVLHTCDNRACIQNDDEGGYVVDGREFKRQGHLWLGTHQDNMYDKAEKGRSRNNATSGAKHCHAKLNDEKAKLVRELKAAGETYKSLAAHFGVSEQTLYNVVHRITWKHVL